MRIGVYPGTFDPITHGHTDIVVRSLRIFDHVIIAVAPNPRKQPLLDVAERVELAKLATQEFAQVQVEAFDGLLVHYVRQRGALAIIRGVRAFSDFEHEFQMALLNRNLDHQVETVFLMPSEEYSYLTSSVVKELAMLGGPLEAYVHPEVAKRLRRRFHPFAS
ncbi:MAG: pantetheine-phosphate adenylyltransferase [Nitrospirae bacterium]|nr:MAG: pantetheine-phosphate adenylyltransferase [Nitrospirota bacterium]